MIDVLTVDWLRYLRDEAKLSHYARALASLLCTYGRGGEIRPSTRTLADLMQCGLDKVGDAFNELQTAGLIEKIRPAAGRRPNTWCLVIPGQDHKDQTSQNDTLQAASDPESARSDPENNRSDPENSRSDPEQPPQDREIERSTGDREASATLQPPKKDNPSGQSQKQRFYVSQDGTIRFALNTRKKTWEVAVWAISKDDIDLATVDFTQPEPSSYQLHTASLEEKAAAGEEIAIRILSKRS